MITQIKTKRKKIININTFKNILAILLIWWSTFPLFSYYTRAIGFLALVLLWVVFSGLIGSISKISELVITSRYLILFILFSLIFLVLGYGNNILNHIWSLIIIFIYLSIFSVYYKDNINKRIVFNGFLVGLMITSIITIVVLLSDPSASRLILTSSQSELYTSYGVGHYSFIYTLVILSPILLNKIIKDRRLTDILLFSLFLSTVLLASYAIATLFMAALIIIVIVLNMNNKASIIIISIALLTILASISSSTWYNLVSDISNEIVRQRFSDLLDFIYYGNLRDNSSISERFLLYKTSLEGFIQSPLYGQGAHFGISGIDNLVALKIGGHSEILDTLARFGLFFSLPLFLFIGSLLKEIKRIDYVSFIVVLLFMIFVGLINPILTLSFYGFIIILPFMSLNKVRNINK